MPTYDYVCRACGHEFEQFQSITAPVLRKCPKCGKLKLERLIGVGAGVIFKGGGFYETDYRSESYKKAAEAESKASAGGEAGKNGEAKPAETTSKSGAGAQAAEAKSDSSAAAPGSDGASSNRLTITRDSSKADIREAKKLLKHKQQLREKRRIREAEARKKAARKKA